MITKLTLTVVLAGLLLITAGKPVAADTPGDKNCDALRAAAQRASAEFEKAKARAEQAAAKAEKAKTDRYWWALERKNTAAKAAQAQKTAAETKHAVVERGCPAERAAAEGEEAKATEAPLAQVRVQGANSDSHELMAKWEAWIREMTMPRRMSPADSQQIFSTFTPTQWRMERVYQLLYRFGGDCKDLEFDDGAMASASAEAVTGGEVWLGMSNTNKSHTHHDEFMAVIKEVDEAYERYGENICKEMYGKLGPDGSLVPVFRRMFRNDEYNYNTQVLWRAKDICERPKEFFGYVPESAVSRTCANAEKHKALWGD
jgi:hypothetical protein